MQNYRFTDRKLIIISLIADYAGAVVSKKGGKPVVQKNALKPLRPRATALVENTSNMCRCFEENSNGASLSPLS